MNDADCFIAFFCLFFVFHLHIPIWRECAMLSVIGCFTHTWIQMINNKSDRFRISLSTEINAFSAVTTRMNELQSRHRDVQRILTATVSATGVSVDLIKRIEWVSSFEVYSTHTLRFSVAPIRCSLIAFIIAWIFFAVRLSLARRLRLISTRAREKEKNNIYSLRRFYVCGLWTWRNACNKRDMEIYGDICISTNNNTHIHCVRRIRVSFIFADICCLCNKQIAHSHLTWRFFPSPRFSSRNYTLHMYMYLCVGYERLMLINDSHTHILFAFICFDSAIAFRGCRVWVTMKMAPTVCLCLCNWNEKIVDVRTLLCVESREVGDGWCSRLCTFAN